MAWLSDEQFVGHDFLFFSILHSSQDGLEEKKSEDGKHDEELDQDDDPERSSPCHVAESFDIEVKNPGYNL